MHSCDKKCYKFCSTVQDFLRIQELVLAEMRVLANDSKFGENEILKCYAKLSEYRQLTIRFMELVRLVSLEQFARDAENISTALDDFLLKLYEYQVGEFDHHPDIYTPKAVKRSASVAGTIRESEESMTVEIKSMQATDPPRLKPRPYITISPKIGVSVVPSKGLMCSKNCFTTNSNVLTLGILFLNTVK